MPYPSSSATLEEVEKARLVAAKQRLALEASIGLISLHTPHSSSKKTSAPLLNSQPTTIHRKKRKSISQRAGSFLPKRRSARLQRDAPIHERSHKVREDSHVEVVMTEYDDDENFKRQVRRRNQNQSSTAGHHHDLLQNRKRKQRKTSEKNVDIFDMKSEEDIKPPTSSVTFPCPPDSSKNLNCNANLLLGEYLGYQFAEFGKEHVMMTLSTTVKPKFSKMAAVVEWSNAVFLWVNVDGKDYDNVFQKVDGEMRMTWYGGSHHRVDTPMIQRLLQLREGDDALTKKKKTCRRTVAVAPNDNNGLPEMQNHHRFLFCRVANEPYTCLGRVVLREFDGTALPLAFSWALKDYDALVKNLARRAPESTTSESSLDVILKKMLLLENQTKVQVKYEMDEIGSCCEKNPPNTPKYDVVGDDDEMHIVK